MNRPKGWKIILTSTYPGGWILPNKVVCVQSRTSIVYTCIRKTDGKKVERCNGYVPENVREFAINKVMYDKWIL